MFLKKIFAGILCLSMMPMVFMPCGDDFDYKNRIETVSSVCPDSHSHQDCGTDSCAPLCVCLCCGQTSTPRQAISIALFKPASVSKILSLTESYCLSSHQSSVFRPPKSV